MAQRLAPTAARTRGWSSPIRAATVWGSVQIPAPTRRSRVVGAGRRFLTPPSRNRLTLPSALKRSRREDIRSVLTHSFGMPQ